MIETDSRNHILLSSTKRCWWRWQKCFCTFIDQTYHFTLDPKFLSDPILVVIYIITYRQKANEPVPVVKTFYQLTIIGTSVIRNLVVARKTPNYIPYCYGLCVIAKVFGLNSKRLYAGSSEIGYRATTLSDSCSGSSQLK